MGENYRMNQQVFGDQTVHETSKTGLSDSPRVEILAAAAVSGRQSQWVVDGTITHVWLAYSSKACGQIVII